jgi:hypothetical protein
MLAGPNASAPSVRSRWRCPGLSAEMGRPQLGRREDCSTTSAFTLLGAAYQPKAEQWSPLVQDSSSAREHMQNFGSTPRRCSFLPSDELEHVRRQPARVLISGALGLTVWNPLQQPSPWTPWRLVPVTGFTILEHRVGQSDAGRLVLAPERETRPVPADVIRDGKVFHGFAYA